jgi:hypothetical protein
MRSRSGAQAGPLSEARSVRASVGRAAGLIVVLALLGGVTGCFDATRPSVWAENRSARDATFFVTDDSASPAAWYVVPAHTTAHAGSDGLGSSDVRVNVLGWAHEINHVGKCAPGDYDDTLSNVPPVASVRLLIDETGRPSVSLSPEPPGLPHLAQAPLGNEPEDQRCQ